MGEIKTIGIRFNYIELDYIQRSLKSEMEYLLRCRLMQDRQIGHDFKSLEDLHKNISNIMAKAGLLETSDNEGTTKL